MKIELSTVLNLVAFIVVVTGALAFMRFYPDLRRYLQMKSM